MKKDKRYDQYFDDLVGEFSIGYRETKEATQKTLHIHDAFELTLIMSDNMVLDVNEENYALQKGALLLFNSLDLHRIYSVSPGVLRRYVLWFKYDYLNEFEALRGKLLKCFYCRRFDRANCLPLNETQYEEIYKLYERLQEASKQQEAYGSDILVKIRLSELLAEVNRLYLEERISEDSAAADDYQAVYRVIPYIQEHLAENLEQEYLARLAYTDKRKLCDSFRTITGQTTGQYIINSRLSAAKALLVQGMPVSEVCEKTGFGDCCNFSRTFHKHVGLSPKQYAMKYSRTM